MKLLIQFICCIGILFSQNINTMSQFADLNRMSNAEKMEFEEGGTFHFKGMDPNDAIIPEFHLSIKNLIDTLNLNYTTLLRSQIYLHQLKAEESYGKMEVDFSILYEVIDENDEVVYDESFRKNLRLEKEAYKGLSVL